jgi:ubiquinone/menaquinone biosynthesis C-methylase UbiE
LPWELRRSNLSEEEQRRSLNNYVENTINKPGELQLQITKSLASAIGHQLKGKYCLDIGCGRGPWAVKATNLYDKIYALDVDMASVIIAKKYCQENNINNIQFLSATSSALPFADNFFDLINSQAVLEHVDHQMNTLLEINRTLAPGGCFTGDSVNKYNLFTPEPHIDLRLVTFLPKKLTHRISMWLKNFPYDDIKPLSYNNLKLMLHQAFGNQFKIIPFVETSEKAITFTVMKHLPTAFLNIFTHTHYIVVIKAS